MTINAGVAVLFSKSSEFVKAVSCQKKNSRSSNFVLSLQAVNDTISHFKQ
jgi:hypothetical protein